MVIVLARIVIVDSCEVSGITQKCVFPEFLAVTVVTAGLLFGTVVSAVA